MQNPPKKGGSIKPRVNPPDFVEEIKWVIFFFEILKPGVARLYWQGGFIHPMLTLSKMKGTNNIKEACEYPEFMR